MEESGPVNYTLADLAWRSIWPDGQIGQTARILTLRVVHGYTTVYIALQQQRCQQEVKSRNLPFLAGESIRSFLS